MIVRKMRKDIKKFNQMKRSLNEGQAYLEDANSSGDEEYKE